jgi:hypothetical protein
MMVSEHHVKPDPPAPPPLTIEQVGALMDVKLLEFRQDIERMIASRPTHDDVNARIKDAILPVERQMATLNETLGRISQRLDTFDSIRENYARIDGALGTLVTLRGERMESMTEKVADLQREHSIVEATLSGVVKDVHQLNGDVYGVPGVTDGPPTIYKLMDAQTAATTAVSSSIEALKETLQTNLSALGKRLDEHDKYINSRRLWEQRAVDGLKAGLTFIWQTWKGKLIVAGIAAAAGLVALEQQYPGIIRGFFEAVF